MCHLKIVECGCGHKSMSICHSEVSLSEVLLSEVSLSILHFDLDLRLPLYSISITSNLFTDLARLGCALKNDLICEDERNQVVDYKRDRSGMCENCIIFSMFSRNMKDVAEEYQRSTDGERHNLKDDALKQAKTDVSSIIEFESKEFLVFTV